MDWFRSGRRLLSVLGLVIFTLLHSSDCQGYMADLCSHRDIQDGSQVGSGIVGTKNTTVSPSNPCVVRIQTCANCYLSVEPTGPDFYLAPCPNIDRTAKTCTRGCEYLFLFDGYYMNETIKFVFNSYHSTWKEAFQTSSSVLYIGYCHRNIYNAIQLRYKINRKYKKYTGTSSNHWNDKGLVRSPFFPLPYIQNAEWYTYDISRTGGSGYIYLIFTDWHLSYSSEVVIDRGSTKLTYIGTDSRPVVFSKSFNIRIIFETGMEFEHLSSRSGLGFKAVYEFCNNEKTNIPYTNCGSYKMSSEGGTLELTTTNMVNYNLYDCVWVIKTQPGFTKTVLNLLKFSIMTDEDNELEIYGGLTSDGPLLKRYNGKSNIQMWQYSHNEGFYIHLYGRFGIQDAIKFSYASVEVGPRCSQGLFRCNNGYCIASKYKCDRVDNCGDNSDEHYGCSRGSSWQSSSQQTIAVSVIIPVVISIFLIIILFVLFLLVRRYRRANMSSRHSSDLPSISGQMSRRQRRRHRRRGPLSFGEDLPPSYEVAIQSPPLYPNMDMDAPHPDSWMLPKPPPYSESISTQPAYTNNPSTYSSQSEGPLYSSTTDSCQSDPWRQPIQNLSSDSSSFSYADREHVQPTRHSHSTSYSSESSFENSPRPGRFTDINLEGQPDNNRNEELYSEHSNTGDNGDLLPYSQVVELPVRNIILPQTSSVIQDNDRERQVRPQTDDLSSRNPQNARRNKNETNNQENSRTGETGAQSHSRRQPTADTTSVASTATQTKHRHGGKERGQRWHPHAKHKLHSKSQHHASTPVLNSKPESSSLTGRSNTMGKYRSVDNIQNPGPSARRFSPERNDKVHRNKKMNKKHKNYSKSVENVAGACLSTSPDPTSDRALHAEGRGYLDHREVGAAPKSRMSWSPREHINSAAAFSVLRSSTEGSSEALFKQEHFEHKSVGCVNDGFTEENSSLERGPCRWHINSVSSPDVSTNPACIATHRPRDRSPQQNPNRERHMDPQPVSQAKSKNHQPCLQLSPDIENNDDVFV